MRVLRLLLANLDQFKSAFALILLASLVESTLSFMLPVTISEASKGALNLESLKHWLSILAALYFAMLCFQWILRRYAEAFGPKFARHLRLKYFEAFERLSYPELLRHHSGFAHSIVTRLADGLGGITVGILWHWVRSLVAIGLFLVFTWRESRLIALTNFAILSIFVAASTLLSRKMVPLVNELDLKTASLFERYADFFSNIITVKKLGLRSYASAKIWERTDETDRQTVAVQKFHANRWFMLHLLYGASYLSTFAFMLYQVMSGQSSASALILFLGAFTIVKQQAETISEQFKSVLELNGFAKILDGILKLDAPPKPDISAAQFESLKVKELIFQYPNTTSIISADEFELTRGQIVLIEGESGQGKTTFFNLIAGFLTPKSGEILFNGRKLLGDELRNSSVFMSQEVELFHLSIKDNILLGRDRADSELWSALEKLNLSEWVRNLSLGLDSLVGEKGVRISSGQKQRLNLLRAFFLDREVYLLDEPTAHLDPENEEKVVDFLEEKLKHKTALIISHRPGLRRLAAKRYTFLNHELKQFA